MKITPAVLRKARDNFVSQAWKRKVRLSGHNAGAKDQPARLASCRTSGKLSEAFVSGFIDIGYEMAHRPKASKARESESQSKVAKVTSSHSNRLAHELDSGELEEASAIDAKGNMRAAKHKAEADDTRTQAEKFEDAARELGCDPGDDAFKGVLRKLAKPKNG